MKYCELTVWHDGYTDFDYLSVEEQNIVEGCAFPEDIPEEIMESAYGMYDFVEDDFFCNVEDQMCDRLGVEK